MRLNNKNEKNLFFHFVLCSAFTNFVPVFTKKIFYKPI
jgi:hypothetical protein